MPKELVISAAPHETRVAILEDGQLCEIYIEREKEFALVGSIYKGRVTRVLPGMQSAFVDIGLDSDAFLYVGDFLENLEDYDHVAAPAETKIEKMEQQGGSTFVRPASVEGQSGETENPSGASPAGEEDSQPNSFATESDNGPSGNEQTPNAFVPTQPRYSAPPSGQSIPPRTPFGRQDRGSGNFGGQGRGGNDRGNDRGRRRGGRFRRGGRDNDRRPNRDLPQSKYASSSSPSAPRPFTPRPYEPAPPEDLPTDFEPIILPGESLAKYKNRIPGAVQAPAQSSQASQPVEPAAQMSPTAQPELPGLPTSLFAAPTTPEPPQAQNREILTYPPRERSAFTPVHEPEPARAAEVPEVPSVFAGGATELSDEEATDLAEQLAEARHEEVSAQAEANTGTGRFEDDDHPVPETAAETDQFIADVQEQEREDAQERDQEDSQEHYLDQESDQEQESSLGAADEGGSPGNQIESEAESDQALADQSLTDQGLDDQADQIGNVAPPVQGQRQPMSARVSQPNRARFQRPMRRGGRQRSGGGRDHHPARQHDSRSQAPKRPQLISEMLKAGQEILVQIAKEPLGKKGARITSHVALPGRFLVYMPTVNHIGVSRRIGSAEERSRLRRLVTESKGTFPGGFIVRTAAEGAPDDEIRADVEFLGRTWEKTISQAEPRKAPALLHRDLNLVERILRDYVSNDYTAIWINSQEEYSKVVEFVSRFQPKLVDRVKLYTKSTPIFEEFGIQQELDKALRPKVWLKSGGYIVINHTEALVAIDVNTGKYVGRGSTRLEDTIVKTNLEAVKEIVRQIRLRDLGGIIILDFIDMEERRNRDKVMAALDSALRADRAPSKALAFNEFGLVAVTRKRTKQALERVLCQPCPYCTGSGMVKSVPTICYEIQAEARKMSPDLDASSLTLRVHPEIAKTLKTREAALIEELEQITRKSVIIQADPTLHWEQYDIY